LVLAYVLAKKRQNDMIGQQMNINNSGEEVSQEKMDNLGISDSEEITIPISKIGDYLDDGKD